MIKTLRLLVLGTGFLSITLTDQTKADIFEGGSSSNYSGGRDYSYRGYYQERLYTTPAAAGPAAAPAPRPSALPLPVTNEAQIRSQMETLQAEMARMAARLAHLEQEAMYGKTPLNGATGTAPAQASLKD